MTVHSPSSIRTDVAVVGAGPAGSIAAHRLARAGVQVTLIERATFPRDKACGDGVSHDGLAVLARTGLAEWAASFAAPEVLRLTSPDGQVLDIRPEDSEGHCRGRTIPRRLLDARLAEAAVDAGARLLEATRVRGVERDTGHSMHVLTDGPAVDASLVILADGSNAPITRRLGLVREPPEVIAIRRYLAGDVGPTGRMEIYFQRSILPGYTWLFPMGDGQANVGTGTYMSRLVRGDDGHVPLRDILDRFTADPAITPSRLARAEAAGPVRGHPLRTHLGGTRTHAARILVTGDAAGLVSPLTGEGIAPAMESGELAAAHALAALQDGDLSAHALAPYSRALRSRYGDEQRAARIVRLVLGTPRLFNRIFRRMRADGDLALLVGHVIIGSKSPRLLLRPATLLKLMG